MDDLIRIQEEDFSLDEELRHLSKSRTGGIAFFLGVVREGKAGRISEIIVEAYREAALKELGRLREEAIERFQLNDATIIHRTGKLRIGENIVLIGASAPHRRDALRACDYLISQLKNRAPIWKKEISPTGETWIVNTPAPYALLEAD